VTVGHDLPDLMSLNLAVFGELNGGPYILFECGVCCLTQLLGLLLGLFVILWRCLRSVIDHFHKFQYRDCRWSWALTLILAIDAQAANAFILLLLNILIIILVHRCVGSRRLRLESSCSSSSLLLPSFSMVVWRITVEWSVEAVLEVGYVTWRLVVLGHWVVVVWGLSFVELVVQ